MKFLLAEIRLIVCQLSSRCKTVIRGETLVLKEDLKLLLSDSQLGLVKWKYLSGLIFMHTDLVDFRSQNRLYCLLKPATVYRIGWETVYNGLRICLGLSQIKK